MGIGISPADAYVNFLPEQEVIIEYSIQSYRPFDFYTEGPFSEFTRVETISHEDTRGIFRIHTVMPKDYDPPGKHRMYVVAREKVTPGTVNTVAAIRGFVEFDVPFPGHYAAMTVTAMSVNEGEDVPIQVEVLNKGKLPISDAFVTLTVLSEGKRIKTMTSEKFSMEPTGGYKFNEYIPGDELKPGIYELRATIDYEGKQGTESTEFGVGTFDVAITDYTKEMYNNSINPFEIEVMSLWNNRMDKVYMDLAIMAGDSVLSTATTPPFNLLPWEKKRSSFYWNTADIPVGEFDLKIDLNFDGGVRSEKRKIIIKEKVPPEVETPFPLTTVLLVAIVLLLVGFNLYFIIGKRRKEKDDEDRKRGGERTEKEGK